MDHVPGTNQIRSRVMGVKTTYENVTIDQSMLGKHLLDYSRIMNLEMQQVLKNQAALFCKDMVKYSPPFSSQSPGDGDKTAAREKAKDHIKSDINSVFKPLERANPTQVASLGSPYVFAQWITFFKNEKDNPYLLNNRRHFKWQIFGNKFASSATGHRIIESMDDLAKTHEAIRYKRFGPIKKSVKKHGMQFIVKGKGLIKSYIAKKVKNIGIQKSAWYFSAKNIGNTKVSFPTWCQHVEGQLNEISEFADSDVFSSVTVGNKIGKVVDARLQFVLQRRAAAMRKQMKSFMNSRKITLADAIRTGKIYGTAPLFSD